MMAEDGIEPSMRPPRDPGRNGNCSVPAAPSGSRISISDCHNPYLQLRVTDRGSKSFVVRKRIGCRMVRLALGSFQAMTVEQARKCAALHCTALAEMFGGVNPHRETRAGKARDGT